MRNNSSLQHSFKYLPPNKRSDMSKDLQAKVLEKIGRRTKRQLYSLHSGVRFVNHASNGSTMRQIGLKENALKAECERMPDVWFKRNKRDLFDKNRAALVAHLGVSRPEQLVFTVNDGDSWNYVLDSVYLDENDGLALVNDHLNEDTMQVLKKHRLTVIQVPAANSTQGILKQFASALARIKDLKRISIVLIEHVAVNTTFVYPIAQIVAMLRTVFGDAMPTVVVDGTNAFGQAPIDLAAMQCDYYVSNMHKWCFAPRSTSFVYVKEAKNPAKWKLKEQDLIQSENVGCLLIRDCLNLQENYFGGLGRIAKFTNR
jgi:isopenicillin-N epimerase